MAEMHEPAPGPGPTVGSATPPPAAGPALPQALVDSLRRREVVLVVGSNCAELAGRPAWRALVRAVAATLPDQDDREQALALLEAGRWPGALAHARHALGAEALGRALATEAASSGEIPEPLVRLLRIPFRAIVTTAIDDLLDRALAADGVPATRIFGPGQLPGLRAHRGRFLLHLCGRAAEPETLCLAPQEVRTLLVDGGVAAFLAELQRDAALLLVGFRPADPDLTLVLDRLLGAAPTARARFLLSDGTSPAGKRVAAVEAGAVSLAIDGSLSAALGALADACAAAIGDDPAPDDAEGWLDRFSLDPDDARARAGFEEATWLLRGRKEWDRLVGVLARHAQLEPERAAQVAALREVARLSELHLAAPGRAYHALDAALKLVGDDPELLEETERVAAAAGLLDELARDHGEALTAAAMDPARRIAVGTARALAEHHRAAGHHEVLAAILERLAENATSDDERVGLLTRIAAAHAARPGAEQEAHHARERAFQYGAHDEETLAALAHAHEGAERWRPFADVLSRQVQVTTLPTIRAARLAQLGRVLLDRLDDPAAAEERYTAALDADPESAPVLAALGELCRRRGDLLRAAKFLADAGQRTRTPLERAQLFAEAGALHHRELHDEARACDLYGRALDDDPEQLIAAEGLAEIRGRQESWVALEPLLDLLLRKAEDPARAVALQARLGQCALALGKREKARRCFEAARAADDPVPALRVLAELLVADGAWGEARAALEELRTRGDALPRADRVAVLTALGKCAARLGATEAAIDAYDEAAALAPDDRVVAEAALALLIEKGDWDAVVTRRRALADKSIGEQRAQLLEDVGDVLLERQRGDEALEAYRTSLAAQPGRRSALHKLLELHTTARRWSEARAALHELIGLESAPPVRAKYAYTAAVIARDHLDDLAGALALFGGALDDDPELMAVYEALEKALIAAGDHVALARGYKKMIKKLPPAAPVAIKLGLLDALTAVALEHTGDRETATLAMEVAVTLDPDAVLRRERLAKLYLQSGPAEADKAIAQHHQLLARQPDRIDSYRALVALYQRSEAYDKLWCVCATLSYLGQLDPQLQDFYVRNRSTDVPVAMGKFTDDVWRLVTHPGEDPFVSAIFALTAPALASTAAQPHSRLGLKRAERVDVSSTDWFPAVALRYISTTFALPLPDVFATDRLLGPTALHNLREKSALTPALVLGPSFSRWTTQWEIVFDLARHAAYLSSERFPRVALMPHAALEQGLRASLALGGCPLPGSGGDVDKLVKKISPLVPAPAAAEVGELGRKMLEQGAVPDLAHWTAGADMTATRAAFLLAGDLGAAAHVLGGDAALASPLPLHDRLRDLLVFSVSEPYFAARELLGLSIR